MVSPRRPPLGLVSRLRRLRVVSLASGARRRRLRIVVASRHPFRLLRRFVSGPQLRLEPHPPLRVRSHRGVHPNRSQELELALEPPQNRPVPLGLRGEPSLKRLPLPANVLVVRVGVVPRRVHRQRLRLDLRHERRARRKPRLARAERRRGVEPPKDADPLAPRERPHARRRRRRQRVVAEQMTLGRARTVVVAFGFGGFGGVAFGGGLDARARSVHLDGDVRRERGGRGARLEEALAVEEDVAARLLGGGGSRGGRRGGGGGGRGGGGEGGGDACRDARRGVLGEASRRERPGRFEPLAAEDEELIRRGHARGGGEGLDELGDPTTGEGGTTDHGPRGGGRGSERRVRRWVGTGRRG